VFHARCFSATPCCVAVLEIIRTTGKIVALAGFGKCLQYSYFKLVRVTKTFKQAVNEWPYDVIMLTEDGPMTA